MISVRRFECPDPEAVFGVDLDESIIVTEESLARKARACFLSAGGEAMFAT